MSAEQYTEFYQERVNKRMIEKLKQDILSSEHSWFTKRDRGVEAVLKKSELKIKEIESEIQKTPCEHSKKLLDSLIESHENLKQVHDKYSKLPSCNRIKTLCNSNKQNNDNMSAEQQKVPVQETVDEQAIDFLETQILESLKDNKKYESLKQTTLMDIEVKRQPMAESLKNTGDKIKSIDDDLALVENILKYMPKDNPEYDNIKKSYDDIKSRNAILKNSNEHEKKRHDNLVKQYDDLKQKYRNCEQIYNNLMKEKQQNTLEDNLKYIENMVNKIKSIISHPINPMDVRTKYDENCYHELVFDLELLDNQIKLSKKNTDEMRLKLDNKTFTTKDIEDFRFFSDRCYRINNDATTYPNYPEELSTMSDDELYNNSVILREKVKELLEQAKDQRAEEMKLMIVINVKEKYDKFTFNIEPYAENIETHFEKNENNLLLYSILLCFAGIFSFFTYKYYNELLQAALFFCVIDFSAKIFDIIFKIYNFAVSNTPSDEPIELKLEFEIPDRQISKEYDFTDQKSEFKTHDCATNEKSEFKSINSENKEPMLKRNKFDELKTMNFIADSFDNYDKFSGKKKSNVIRPDSAKPEILPIQTNNKLSSFGNYDKFSGKKRSNIIRCNSTISKTLLIQPNNKLSLFGNYDKFSGKKKSNVIKYNLIKSKTLFSQTNNNTSDKFIHKKSHKELTLIDPTDMKKYNDIANKFENEFAGNTLLYVDLPHYIPYSCKLNDSLNNESPVTFETNNDTYQIVHSHAKLKRVYLSKFSNHFTNVEGDRDTEPEKYRGIYTKLSAVRAFEKLDPTHSFSVRQIDYCFKTKQTNDKVKKDEILQEVIDKAFDAIGKTINDTNSSEQTTLYKSVSSKDFFEQYLDKLLAFPNGFESYKKEFEQKLSEDNKFFSVCQIGWPYRLSKEGVMYCSPSNKDYKECTLCTDYKKCNCLKLSYDHRSCDYDDWDHNCDLYMRHDTLGPIEISSMGYRVDSNSLSNQLKYSNVDPSNYSDYHKQIIDGSLQQTIGGGIGIDRLLMCILNKNFVSEINPN
jgi:aspartate--ammonia ligase